MKDKFVLSTIGFLVLLRGLGVKFDLSKYEVLPYQVFYVLHMPTVICHPSCSQASTMSMT